MELKKEIILAAGISLIIMAVGCNSCHPGNVKIETETVKYDFPIDSSNLDFLNSDMSWQDVQKYEKSLSSVEIVNNLDKGISTPDVSVNFKPVNSSGELVIYSEVRVSEEIFPYNDEITLTSPLFYMRKYTCGLPMKTSYFFNNKKTALQIHEWGCFGNVKLNDVSRKDFENIFLQIQEKITKIKGAPVDNLSNNSSTFDIIWDNPEENIRLKLNDADTTYNIKLYQYGK